MRSIVQLAGHQSLIDGCHGTFVYNHYGQYVGWAPELCGKYSELEVDLFRQLLEPGHDVVEVGANIDGQRVFQGACLQHALPARRGGILAR